MLPHYAASERAKGWKLWWSTIFFCTAFIGAALFSRGFLHVRHSIEEKSECNDPPVKPVFFPNLNWDNGCWMPAKAGKIILVVIDALRTDFVLSSKPGPHRSSAWFDKLTIINELALKDPERAQLLYFIADPPTATTPRLTALTAGTIPAFVEVAANFAEQSLGSDNIVHQLLASGKFPKLDIYGDDTWLSLFPEIREKSKGKIAGYHSLHLFDLHSVDNGIKEHLFPALEAQEFDLLIAHFLGVDHCGHKYGPALIPCGEKLTEMDQVLRRVIQEMNDDTRLIVMGDHGMTDNGDHGGIAPKEISTILFTFDKSANRTEHLDQLFWKNFLSRVDSERRKTLNIEDRPFFAFTNQMESLKGSVSQIDFTPTFSLLAGLPIPFGNIGCIIPELMINYDLYLSATATEARLRNLKFLVDAIRINSYQMIKLFDRCQKVGESGFEEESLLPLLEKLERAEGILQGRLLSESSEELADVFFEFQQFVLSAQTFCRSVWADFDLWSIGIGLTLGTLSVVILLIGIFLKNRTVPSVFSLFLSLLHMFALATTTFITFEDVTVRFLICTLVIQKLLSSFFTGTLTFKQFLRGMTVLLLLRVTSFTGACREEQYPYCKVITHRSIPWELSTRVIFIVITAVLGLFWILQKCHSSMAEVKSSLVSLFGHLLYFSILTLLGIHWLWIWMSDTVDVVEGGSGHQPIDAIMEQITDIIIPRALFVLCSLGTIIFRRNGSLLLFSVIAFIGIVLRPFAGWTLLVAGCALLQVGSALFTTASDSTSLAVYCYLVGMHLFFVTGHQATLTTLQWEVAFTGLQTTIQSIAALFMALNTFSGPIVATVFLCIRAAKTPPLTKDIITVYLWYSVAQLIASAAFTAVLMRHLMVWKMFTPRFLMQAVMSFLNLLIIGIIHLIIPLTDKP